MAAPIRVKAVVVTAFEPDAGPVPGEFRYWREREGLTREMEFAAGYRPLWLSEKGVLGIVTGVGAVRAAASVMALGLDERFDLREAYWLVSGGAGVDPARASLGSVVLPEWVVDGNLTHEIDGREIPADWVDGFVPIGKGSPYEEPREARFNGDDGICFRLNSGLVSWAFELTRDTELLDTAGMAERRAQFGVVDGPRVVRGDELSSSTFWHGRLMSERARRWVAYQTSGRGTYSVSGMEDAGILQALTFLGGAGRVDSGRVLVLRGASNFDQQRAGLTAGESLGETRVASYSAYLPALENLWRVGTRVLREWV
jgi:purine nucleoside permease